MCECKRKVPSAAGSMCVGGGEDASSVKRSMCVSARNILNHAWDLLESYLLTRVRDFVQAPSRTKAFQCYQYHSLSFSAVKQKSKCILKRILKVKGVLN